MGCFSQVLIDHENISLRKFKVFSTVLSPVNYLLRMVSKRNLKSGIIPPGTDRQQTPPSTTASFSYSKKFSHS